MACAERGLGPPRPVAGVAHSSAVHVPPAKLERSLVGSGDLHVATALIREGAFVSSTAKQGLSIGNRRGLALRFALAPAVAALALWPVTPALRRDRACDLVAIWPACVDDVGHRAHHRWRHIGDAGGTGAHSGHRRTRNPPDLQAIRRRGGAMRAIGGGCSRRPHRLAIGDV